MEDATTATKIVELEQLEVSSESERNIEMDTFDKVELSPESTEVNAGTPRESEPNSTAAEPEVTATRDWKQKFISAAGYTKGEETIFWIGLGMDLCFFCIWLILIFTVIDAATRNRLWWMPLLGISFHYSLFCPLIG